MDVQLNELIEKIKTEGVSSAKEEAATILDEARNKKAEIIKEAEAEAEKIRSNAKADAARMEQSGKAALQQASRDLILQVRRSIEAIGERVLQAKSSEALSGEALAAVIKTAVEKWDGGEGELTVLVSEKDAEKLGKGLEAELSKLFKAGVELKPFSGISAGFRIGSKESGSYFDFSAKEIADMLAQLVNPQVAALVEEAAKES